MALAKIAVMKPKQVYKSTKKTSIKEALTIAKFKFFVGENSFWNHRVYANRLINHLRYFKINSRTGDG